MNALVLDPVEMVVVAKVEVPCTLKRPDTVKAVAEAVARVVCPATPRVLVKYPLPKVKPVPDIPVVEALVVVRAEMNALVKVIPEPDIAVVEAFVTEMLEVHKVEEPVLCRS